MTLVIIPALSYKKIGLPTDTVADYEHFSFSSINHNIGNFQPKLAAKAVIIVRSSSINVLQGNHDSTWCCAFRTLGHESASIIHPNASAFILDIKNFL